MNRFFCFSVIVEERRVNNFATEELNVSLATVDCMFDILSDSALEAGLFSCGEVPTPIQSRSRNDAPEAMEEVPSNELGAATNSTRRIEPAKSAVISLSCNPAEKTTNRKRRASFIPTIGGRKSVYLADELNDSQAAIPEALVAATPKVYSNAASTPISVSSSGIQTRASTRASLLTRKSILILDESEMIEPTTESIKNNEIQNAIVEEEEPAKKKPATLANRRKSLATISNMLNTVSSIDFGDIGSLCKPTITLTSQVSAVDENDETSENKPVPIRSSARRKSMLENPTGGSKLKEQLRM
jgi:hypothetical protein